MQCFTCCVSKEDGTSFELEIWATSYILAKDIAIYTWAGFYFKEIGKPALNLYYVEEGGIIDGANEFVLAFIDPDGSPEETPAFLFAIRHSADARFCTFSMLC